MFYLFSGTKLRIRYLGYIKVGGVFSIIIMFSGRRNVGVVSIFEVVSEERLNCLGSIGEVGTESVVLHGRRCSRRECKVS